MLTMVFRSRAGWGSERRRHQLVNNVVDPTFDDGLGDTSPQMRFQNVPTYPIQGTLHSRKLMENVDAIAVVFHHTDYPI